MHCTKSWQLCLLASVLQAASTRKAWEGHVALLLAIARARNHVDRAGAASSSPMAILQASQGTQFIRCRGVATQQEGSLNQ